MRIKTESHKTYKGQQRAEVETQENPLRDKEKSGKDFLRDHFLLRKQRLRRPYNPLSGGEILQSFF